MWECRAAHQVRFPMRGLWGGLVLMGTKGHTRAPERERRLEAALAEALRKAGIHGG